MKKHSCAIGAAVYIILAAISFCQAEMLVLVNPFANQPVLPLFIDCSLAGTGADSEYVSYWQLPFQGLLVADVTSNDLISHAVADTQKGFIDVTLDKGRGLSSVEVFTTTLPTSGVLEFINPYQGSATFAIELWAPSDNGLPSTQAKLLGLIIWTRNQGGMNWWVERWVNGTRDDTRIAEGYDAFNFNNLTDYVTQITDGRTLGYYKMSLRCYSDIGGTDQLLHAHIDFAQWRKLTITTSPLNNIPVQPGVGDFSYPQKANVPIVAAQYNNCPDVYIFDHWEGQDILDPNEAATTVLMDTDVQITAVFVVTRNCGDACHPNDLLGDFNHDCIVDFEDFSNFAENWLVCTKPEPNN